MAQVEQYVKCKEELLKFIDENNCAPIMVRLAWHDSGNFDKRIASWPECGGANGSIIHEPEINYGANAGLSKAVNFLKPFKEKYPALSWADLIQMASACAIQATGGPILPMKYGRVDVKDAMLNHLPSAKHPCKHWFSCFWFVAFSQVFSMTMVKRTDHVENGTHLPTAKSTKTKDGSACPGRTSRGTADNAGLPDAMAPFGCGAKDPATHLRKLGCEGQTPKRFGSNF